jgi:hypothetical protein
MSRLSLNTFLGRGSIDEIAPGRYVIGPRARTRAIAEAVERAKSVQFSEPLPKRSLRALAAALRESPSTELYVYGHYGLEIDQDLRFLAGFETIERLSLNLHGLRSLEALARFPRLRSLSVAGIPTKLSLAPLAELRSLESLSLPGPVKAPEVLSELTALRELSMPSAQPLLDALAGHPSLERLALHFGAGTDLRSLATLRQLRDLEIWQITKLSTGDLDPAGAIPHLETLALGAARHVRSLEFLEDRSQTLRYLQLEKAPSLPDLKPVASLEQLRACGLFDARPANRSLEPLTRLSSLRDLTIGDVYPSAEVDQLFAALPTTRIRVRDRETAEPSRLHWRGLFAYATSDRDATHAT